MDNLAAEFTISNENHFDCLFEIYTNDVFWGDIYGDITNQTDLINILNTKQDSLIAGDNIQITDNIISATDTTYTAGTGISIDNGIISNTQTSAEWGNITGTLSDQTDLKDELDTLNGQIAGNHSEITDINLTLQGYGDIVTYNATDFATSSQGALADTALQPNDNISELVNDVGYITSSSLPTVNDATITIQKNGSTVESFTLNQSGNETINITVPTTASDIGALPDTTTIDDLMTTTQLAAINSGANTTNIGQIATNTQDIADEVTNRQNADNGLQTQIDALVVASDVFDIVGTYAELQAYDISTVPVNDIIKVLVDSTHNDAATYYRCVENNNVKSWSYIGAEGAYYTKSEADNRFVAQTITVNGQPLSSNVTLTAADVGALPDSTVIPTVNNATLTIQKNGTTVDTFTANSSTNTTVNITVPTDTNDLTNGAGYITGITSGDVTTALGYTPYNSSNPNGYISGITSTDVTTALGYTPYDSSNPSGYTSNVGTVTSVNTVTPVNGNVTLSIPTDTSDLTNGAGFLTSSDLTNYVTTNTAQDITARKTFIGEKAIYFKQTADTNKLGFTLYDKNNTELGALEWRPNTISSSALLALNCPQSGTNYVGFRYWANINIVAPRPTTNGTYFMTVGVTDGSNTVTTTSNGVLNISTLLSGFQTTSNLVTSVSSSSTDSQYPSAKLFYDTCGDIETLINAL